VTVQSPCETFSNITNNPDSVASEEVALKTPHTSLTLLFRWKVMCVVNHVVCSGYNDPDKSSLINQRLYEPGLYTLLWGRNLFDLPFLESIRLLPGVCTVDHFLKTFVLYICKCALNLDASIQ
jgi:hypothetical protein